MRQHCISVMVNRARVTTVAGAATFILALLPAVMAPAKVDLVVLPDRDAVQLTIYNSADLTLVRERRDLTLRQGWNELQFSWVNTLIDPTSLELRPMAAAGDLDISELMFPPRTSNLGVWKINSRTSGKVPVEILYLTSGLAWRAFYLATLAPDESVMQLEGFVNVANSSGEDYEDAQTRLIVGQVHILDAIAALAIRDLPYGRPNPPVRVMKALFAGRAAGGMRDEVELELNDMVLAGRPAEDRKAIAKEGLSEYFLYTIEGTETIPHGWAKRLPSFTADNVPVHNLYKYDEQRYGGTVMRFLSFTNDTAHHLGQVPIPDGMLKVFRATAPASATATPPPLAYEGQSTFKYIPVGEGVELDLGPALNVTVEPELMNTLTDNYVFNRKGNITGWDQVDTWRIRVRNTRPLPVQLEIQRHVSETRWEIQPDDRGGQYEKVDRDTVKFTLDLPAGHEREFQYVLTTRHGARADQ